jgi:HSP20 family protein
MTGMARWVLFEEVREAQAELLRLNAMRGRWLKLGQQFHPGMSRPPWNPAVDISERKDAYVVAAEVPGGGIDDLDITYQDGLLTLEGTRRAAPTLAEERRRKYPPSTSRCASVGTPFPPVRKKASAAADIHPEPPAPGRRP